MDQNVTLSRLITSATKSVIIEHVGGYSCTFYFARESYAAKDIVKALGYTRNGIFRVCIAQAAASRKVHVPRSGLKRMSKFVVDLTRSVMTNPTTPMTVFAKSQPKDYHQDCQRRPRPSAIQAGHKTPCHVPAEEDSERLE